MPTRVAAWFGLLLTCFVHGCSKPEDAGRPSTGASPSAGGTDASSGWKPEFIDDDRLQNAFRVNEKVISGGVPEETSMQALKQLGVRTIVSVDGAQPDVELAKRYGMRYVHLPHGYDGIPDQRAMELAKAVSELEGPIYIHCHHGKHRSPAAAATACVVAGMISPEQGLTLLKSAGTSEGYRGLFRNVRESKPADRAVLEAIKVDYRESMPVPPMAEAMVALERTHERLVQLQKHGWKPFRNRPDVDAAHEALLLEEHYTELLRTPEVRKQPEEFQRLLQESEAASRELKEQLNPTNAIGRSDAELLARDQLLDRVTRNCKACHLGYRDNRRELN